MCWLCPGQGAQLFTAQFRHTETACSTPSPGTYEKQPVKCINEWKSKLMFLSLSKINKYKVLCADLTCSISLCPQKHQTGQSFQICETMHKDDEEPMCNICTPATSSARAQLYLDTNPSKLDTNLNSIEHKSFRFCFFFLMTDWEQNCDLEYPWTTRVLFRYRTGYYLPCRTGDAYKPLQLRPYKG